MGKINAGTGKYSLLFPVPFPQVVIKSRFYNTSPNSYNMELFIFKKCKP